MSTPAKTRSNSSVSQRRGEDARGRDHARAGERRIGDEDAARRAHRERLAQRLGGVRRRHREQRDLAARPPRSSLSAASSAYSSLPLTTAGLRRGPAGRPAPSRSPAEAGSGTGLMSTTMRTRRLSSRLAAQRALAEQCARDDEPLDLLRPLVELRDLGVAHHPLDRELVDIAVSAQDLHGVGRDPHRGVTGDEFTHRRPPTGVRRARVDLDARLVQELARGLGRCVHVGEHRARPSGNRRSAARTGGGPGRTRSRPRARPGRSRRPARRSPVGCGRSVRIAMSKPSPSSPTRFAAGTRTPSKASSAVGLPRRPILCSSRATEKPGGRDLDDEARQSPMARSASGSVTAKTVMRSATEPWLMNRFEPSMTYSSPSRTARGARGDRVRAGLGLGQGERDELLAGGELRDPARLLLGACRR